MCISLCELHKKLFAMPWAALAILAAAAGSLLTAFVAQHVFDIQPCILCLFQRVPYAVVVILSSLALLVRHRDKSARCLLGICALVFFINVGIAFFHTGVERHWWAGTNGCAVNQEVLRDPEAARMQLLKTAVAQCDEINFSFLGLSMANWNVMASLVLGLFALIASFGPCVNWAKPKSSGGGSCCCGCGPDKKDSCG